MKPKIVTSILLFLPLLLISAVIAYLATHQDGMQQQEHYVSAQPGTRNNNASNLGSTGSASNPEPLAGAAEAGVQSKNLTNNSNKSSIFLTYENHDFGIKMQYPSDWIKMEDNLLFHTIAAFQLIHENIYDFTNATLAEVDLRVYKAPQNETSAKLSIGQINTQGQVISNYYKNSTINLGGLPAIKIVNYFFGDVTQKELQVWTFVPGKNVLVEIIYIAQPSKYSLYLPNVQKMIDSVKISY